MRALPMAPALLLLAACTQDIGLTESSRCDGLQQRGEDTVDAPFDRDGDGFFDGANPGCQSVYDVADLDCDDTDPESNPDAEEQLCDGRDNDCDPDTPDEVDADGDGFFSCEDCNDNDPAVNPGLLEVDCNGVDDDCDPSTLDGVDYDGDGYDECADCDEQRNQVNPGAIEVFCDGLDNDCNPGTEDSPDADLDGVGECEDCDDNDPQRAPSLAEECEDEIDNDCDGAVDEDCSSGYDGDWFITPAVTYSCAANQINLNLVRFEVVDLNPAIYVTFNGDPPGALTGTFTSATEFTASRTITGGCTEEYILTGTFLSDSEFSGTFRANYTPSGRNACGGGFFPPECTNQAWAVTGTKR